MVIIIFYSLLTGVISVLANVRQFNDLAHPLCRNLRDGDWMMDYVVARFLPFVGTRQVSLVLLVLVKAKSTFESNLAVAHKTGADPCFP